jgi:hypothetical protein
MKRLTAHLAHVKPIKEKVGKEGKLKTKLINTLSVRNLRSQADVNDAISYIRSHHKIAICEAHNHNKWKVGEEMWYTSNEV